MISTPDREQAIRLIDEARASGARLEAACAELGLTRRVYGRWRDAQGVVAGDARPDAERPTPANRLTPGERAEVLETVHRPEYASLPPGQIVPALADAEQRYIASESTFYRILRAEGEQHHRGRAQAPRESGPATTHTAHGPNEVWTADISWLPTRVRGMFFYLYLVLDLYSRKIVAAEVCAAENGASLSAVMRRAIIAEQCAHCPPVLHTDNGSPMKGSTFKATLEWLQITPSYSRPRVSNDNAFSEAMFRTCKYRPAYPVDGFADISAAQAWIDRFVSWYNHEHRHSGIRYVTPGQRHRGEDGAILEHRHALYQQARARRPERWSGDTRDWSPIGPVTLNPDTGEAASDAAHENRLEVA
jgi:transposase InsO family protein